MMHRNKKYKMFIADYNPQTNSLLVSFSSEDTKQDAKDYQSYSYDLINFGKDKTPEDILMEIARTAPTICEEIELQETFKVDKEDSNEFLKLERKEFEYTHEQLFPSLYQKEKVEDFNEDKEPHLEPAPDSMAPSESSEEI